MRASTASAQERLGLGLVVGGVEGETEGRLGAGEELGWVVGVPPPHEQRRSKVIATVVRLLGRLIDRTFCRNGIGEAETEPTR